MTAVPSMSETGQIEDPRLRLNYCAFDSLSCWAKAVWSRLRKLAGDPPHHPQPLEQLQPPSASAASISCAHRPAARERSRLGHGQAPLPRHQAIPLTQRRFNRSSTLVRDGGRMNTALDLLVSVGMRRPVHHVGSGQLGRVCRSERQPPPSARRAGSNSGPLPHVRFHMAAPDVVDNHINAVLCFCGPRKGRVGYPAWKLSRSPPQDSDCRRNRPARSDLAVTPHWPKHAPSR